MNELKLNQKVWHIEINNAVKEKSYRPNGVVIEELKVIGISKHKICLNNDWFTTLEHTVKGKKKESYNTYIDNTSVSIRTGDHILNDGIFLSMYSSKKPTKSILNKMAAKASVKIDKEYGFLMGGAKDTIYDFVDNYKF